MDKILHFYRTPGVKSSEVMKKLNEALPSTEIQEIETEFCFNVSFFGGKSFTVEERDVFLWLITETFEPENVVEDTSFLTPTPNSVIIEVGPRLAFSTAWSSNCVSMCQACGINSLKRVERSRRYKLTTVSPLSKEELVKVVSQLHDRMTECIYPRPIESFDNGATPEPVKVVPLLERGKIALEELNKERGLGFDAWDIDFYSKMFIETLKRNPTDVELFDLGQSNSEHSRHWFFGGKMIIDGEEKKETLFQMVKATLPNNSNSVIAFHDNSSSIYGFDVDTVTPSNPRQASPLFHQKLLLHPILTAETHNFPSGVAPFPGAETGTGGRLRDVQATGRGAHTIAGVCGYCVGQLQIPSDEKRGAGESPFLLPWETPGVQYANNLASPVDILVEASNGASDYGNKYGEPVICGFARSFGQKLPNGERVEWIKPIMFTAGVGQMDARHSQKGQPEVGMVVCKIGGPAYRIGMGGGAASSKIQDEDEDETQLSQSLLQVQLDFEAVQRGDAEMGNRLNRFVRGCVELGLDNPIVSIHDQGAGGNGNVLKEIVDPLGAKLDLKTLPLGDPTLSVLEIWGAEYQENNAFLVKPEHLSLVQELAKRENCPLSAVGTVTGDGTVIAQAPDGSFAFNMPLSLVLGKMPQKTFIFETPKITLNPLAFPTDLSLASALNRVLMSVDVGSKRFLTNKVDRSVTGLIAQQQCVGKLHIPVADVAVVAQSHFGITGIATAVGEQPIKGLISSGAQARMTATEALSNLVFASITKIEDIKCSGNWMWAAKLPGEGAKMYECCEALKKVLIQLGVGIDGGKDSLSMAAKVEKELVKSPGELTLTLYAPCVDVNKTITPDFKHPGKGKIVFVRFSDKMRLGGSTLSTVYGQLGDECADLENPPLFRAAFNIIQRLISQGLVTAGHDRSDGGLVTTVLEMAFAGNCGVDISVNDKNNSNLLDNLTYLFNEEPGFIFEVLPENLKNVLGMFSLAGITCEVLGTVTEDKKIKIERNGVDLIEQDMRILRDKWEETSFSLEMRQCDNNCVSQEKHGLAHREGPAYKLTFPIPTVSPLLEKKIRKTPCVAVIRQEGSNGDREMAAAFHTVGFEVWDVNMNDLLTQKVRVEQFNGIVFCGGFSYADVNDSAKGWAAAVKFNKDLLLQFEQFRARTDVFSLGVCNGCQLMALLGWVPFPEGKTPVQNDVNPTTSHSEGDIFPPQKQMRFIHNDSGRFESRWSTVQILPSKSVLLKDMEGSSLGVWVAHGEGKAFFPDKTHLNLVEQHQLAPLRYVDDDNNITETYPFNPNGSPHGIAGVCSTNGLHLALMPHPERCFLPWQLPFIPPGWTLNKDQKTAAAPWVKLFTNAKEFIDQRSGFK